MNFEDYVAVELADGKRGRIVHKDYAAANGLKVLADEPVLARGRLRSTFRIDGRLNKPKVRLPRAIPTPQPPDENVVSGEPDSASVENNKES